MLKKMRNAGANWIYRRFFQQAVQEKIASAITESVSHNYLNSAPSLSPIFHEHLAHLSQHAYRIERVGEREFVVSTSFVADNGDIISDAQIYKLTNEASARQAAINAAAMLEKKIATTH